MSPGPEERVALSGGLRRLILLELTLPTVLLVFGVYHGFLQTLYRSGLIKAESVVRESVKDGLTAIHHRKTGTSY